VTLAAASARHATGFSPNGLPATTCPLAGASRYAPPFAAGAGRV
jgi:hypothetical protein